MCRRDPAAPPPGVAGAGLRALKCLSLNRAARSVSMSQFTADPCAARRLRLSKRIGRALDALRHGRAVVLFDDADRENEADLIVAAERLTEPMMALMIR